MMQVVVVIDHILDIIISTIKEDLKLQNSRQLLGSVKNYCSHIVR